MAAQIVRSAFNPITGKEEVTIICDTASDLPNTATDYSCGSLAFVIRANPLVDDKSGVAIVKTDGTWEFVK